MDSSYLKNFMHRLTEWVIPGNSIVVYQKGKKVFEYSSGYADLANKIKMTGKEHLYIYSCSKPATVTAALQLYEQGEFLMSDPLYDFIPEFREMRVRDKGGIKRAKNPITIGQLFTMTAGLTYNMDTPCFKKARNLSGGKMDTLTVIRCLADEPLAFEPGTRWNYSLCHDVLAAVVEVISGKRFSQYVKENIFDPLDMKESGYHMTPEIKENMAQQYRFKTDAETDIVKLQSSRNRSGHIVNVGISNDFMFGEEYESGGAGIITTVGDYAKFAAALANKGMGLNNNRILSAGSVELMKLNHLNEEQLKGFDWPQLLGYGYGLGVRTLMDKSASGSLGPVGEFGWAGAAGANLLMDTESNIAVFYAHHMLNPQEEYYQPRLRNAVYLSLN